MNDYLSISPFFLIFYFFILLSLITFLINTLKSVPYTFLFNLKIYLESFFTINPLYSHWIYFLIVLTILRSMYKDKVTWHYCFNTGSFKALWSDLLSCHFYLAKLYIFMLLLVVLICLVKILL